MKHILLILLALNSGFCVNAQMPAGFKDFNVASGLASSAPMYLAGMNGKLYFYGSNGSSGREPFYMESTGISQLIQNMNPGGNHCIGIGYTNPSAIMNNKYYFTATNGSSGEEMFMYDGTNPPTIVFDPTFGPDSSQPDNYVVYNNSLYFTATTATEGSELYVFDGINTPVRLTDINSGAEGSVFGPMVLLGDKLIFSGKTWPPARSPGPMI